MKKNHIFLISSLLFFIAGAGFANADAWNLPGVTIVTRAQWGADESRKYTARPEYQAMLASQTQQYVNEADEEAQKESAQKSAIANQFALDHFPQDILIDKSINLENGNALRWPLEYKYNKSKIIVHHSATAMSAVHSENDMKALLQSVYKYHSFTHGRGDIGYNFIISPDGVIYEGRAGGEGVVGAHASWNNQPSIGVALIGNFNNDIPSDAQISSLTNLITALSRKYNIDPEAHTNRHRKSSDYPYVSTFQNYTVVGHKDVGPTECPGTNLYNLLPAIRDTVENNLKSGGFVFSSSQTQSSPSILSTAVTPKPMPVVTPTRPSLPLPPNSQKSIFTLPPVVAPTGTYTLRTRTTAMGTTLPKCQVTQGDVTIAGCVYHGGQLIISIRKHNNNLNPGTIHITAKSRTTEVNLSVDVKWQVQTAASVSQPAAFVASLPTVSNDSSNNPSNALLEQRKKLFSLPAVSATIKIALPTPVSDVAVLMKKQMRVLLYNASTQSSSWMLTCTGTCTISDSPFTTVLVSSVGGMLTIQKNGLSRKGSSLSVVSASGSMIAVTDSVTHSQYGIYRGNIDIFQQSIKKIDGTYTSQYAVINTLPMEQYLAGIGEASDSEPIEKTKVLALLTKAYALYYVGGSSSHPSIPAGAQYNAIDDPRFFQKYVGETWEQKSKNWPIAMTQTKDEYVTYNNILPILPYFHCSPGFTRSAREKWGWTDTPYLQSVVDDSSCTDFQGHGVGLSGQGATKKAQSGMKAEDIITYYYPGTQLQLIK